MAAIPPAFPGAFQQPPPPPNVDPFVVHLIFVFGFSFQLVAALIGQGCSNNRSLYNLYNTKDGIVDMVKKVTQPGGYIDDPNHAGPGPAPQIVNRGIAVTAAQQNLLVCLGYYIRHKYRINRHIDLQEATIDRMSTMSELMNMEKNNAGAVR
jgi:hypothetical protein